ncbi:MAG: N-acetylmuramoyl-L-alanine amidase [Gammaproteobacteria bacterium]|nr:N-acetylmuramoyl-L-alanine amidase [Gammaproteobacteria bacterium]MDP6616264.1 N-acetylmuramoyl-L-alanine amidase [Gammaproteobacteria bacterium]MDP6695429.1 N-acetylmuramoyl-L-alanine amidase [Gammaproteobacteria bacterium]
MRGLRLVTGLCMLTLASQLAAQTAHIKKVRIAHTGDRTRVVLDLDRGADHKLFTLSNPNRVVVDLAGGSFALGGAKLPQGDGMVAKMRGADRDNGTARLVLDLGNAARPKSFALAPSGNYGHRIVVDLTPVDAAPKVVKRAPQAAGSRDLIVAIDPGHGGKDPGARGRGGLVEKKAVLQISKRLANLINDEPGMRAILTRNGDQFLKLRQRRERAEKAGADLFVSIHADAFSDRRVSGATVYVLSRKGASDEAAELLAKRENDADLIGGVDIKGKDPMLASVLVDLSQNAALEASVEVANAFITEMSRVGKMRKRRVQKAGFRVLKSPDIPSILVETAFISNPQEESNLKSVQYQQRLAQAMHKGVKAYFYANPPTGTRIAQLARERKLVRQHVIRRGDTLSEIAQRYQVSVSRIRSKNKLSGNRIRIGQVLLIPPG